MGIMSALGSPIIPPIPTNYLECVKDITVVGHQTNVDITGLNMTVDLWYRVLIKTANASGSTIGLEIYFDSDYTATNYYSEYMDADGTTLIASRLNTPNFEGLTTLQQVMCSMEITQDLANYTRCISMSNRYAPNIMSSLYRNVCHNVAGSFTAIRIHSTVASAISSGTRILIYRYKGL
jgi:hypothetical protein